MTSRCYICYEKTNNDQHYHEHCLKKIFNTNKEPELDFNIKDTEHLACELIKLKIGIPGVQRKLSISVIPRTKEDNTPIRLTIVGYLNGEYILKPPTIEYPFMPEIEDLTMHLAEIANLSVALHSLIPAQNNQLAYITKRFDRAMGRKIAVEDFCQLSLKLTEHKYRSSHEAIAKVISQYTSTPGESRLQFFELILFSFIVGNADMHLKNFSLITDDLNNIKMAPCYDLLSTRLLIPEHQDSEELALPLNGKKNNLQKKDFMLFGKNLKIPDKVSQLTIKSMINHTPNWEHKINISFLPETLKEKYKLLIQNRIDRLS